jgi:acyl-CoA thioesterase-1
MKTSTLIILVICITLFSVGGFFYFIVLNRAEVIQTATNLKNETENRKTITILAYGDSLTEGFGVVNEDSYPEVLKRTLAENGYTNYQVVKYAKSGDTTTDGLAKFDKAASFEPDIVLLLFGGNDFLQGKPAAEIFKNLDSLIVKFEERRTKVILLGLESFWNPLVPTPPEYKTLYKDLANKHGLILVPSFLKGVFLQSEYTKDDRLHPNEAGYKKIVEENLWPILKRELKK